MHHQQREQRLADIQTSLQQLSDLLAGVADNQDWRVAAGEWSFREIAAHLKTTEAECHQVRIQRLLTETHPHFTYYLNSDRDFSRLDLSDSLRAWADTRQEIIATVRTLPEEKLTRSGRHETFGQVTILDILREMYNHDQAHLQELAPMLEKYRQVQAED